MQKCRLIYIVIYIVARIIMYIQVFANLRWLHVMTVENLLSHQFIEDWRSFHAHLVKFIWFVKYWFDVFTVDLILRKIVFQIDMLPSFLVWWIAKAWPL